MPDRVILSGGSGDGQVAEIDDASTGAVTIGFQRDGKKWRERYLRAAKSTAPDPQNSAEPLPVFMFFERADVASDD